MSHRFIFIACICLKMQLLSDMVLVKDVDKNKNH